MKSKYTKLIVNAMHMGNSKSATKTQEANIWIIHKTPNLSLIKEIKDK